MRATTGEPLNPSSQNYLGAWMQLTLKILFVSTVKIVGFSTPGSKCICSCDYRKQKDPAPVGNLPTAVPFWDWPDLLGRGLKAVMWASLPSWLQSSGSINSTQHPTSSSFHHKTSGKEWWSQDLSREIIYAPKNLNEMTNDILPFDLCFI